MKIALWSDVHWNHDKNSHKRIAKFLKKLANEEFDILVIAGDMATKHVKGIRSFAKTLREFLPERKIAWVLGNHDIAGDPSWRYSNKYLAPTPRGFKRKHLSLQEIFQYIKDVEYEFNIYHLLEEPQKFEDTLIIGYDGWYGSSNPGAVIDGSFRETTDNDKFPPQTDGMPSLDFLKQKAHDDLNSVLYYDKSNFKNKVCVTHFPPYSFNPIYRQMIADENSLPLLCEEFDYLLVGHSHQDEQWNFKGCEIINCGNDYQKCKAKIININTNEVKVINQ